MTDSRARPIVARVVRIDGTLDPEAFDAAIRAMMEYHEPLRSRWIWVGNAPQTQVLEPSNGTESVVAGIEADSSALSLIGPQFVNHVLASINTGSGCSVANGLIKTSSDHWHWIFGVHHLAADAWSLKSYGQTFSLAYDGASDCSIDQRVTSSIEYAITQRVWFETAEAQKRFEWWLNKLGNLAPQVSPLSVASTECNESRFAVRQEISRSRDIRDGIFVIARKRRCPISAVFLGALALVTARRTGISQVSILSNVSGRTLRGSSEATGAFYNTIVLVLELAGASTAGSLVDIATKALCDALENQEVPMSVVNLALLRRNVNFISALPLSLNVIEPPLSDFILPGCLVREIEVSTFAVPTQGRRGPHPIANVTMEPGLSLIVTLMSEELVISAEYITGLFAARDVGDFLDEYASTIEWVVEGIIGESCQRNV
jgi:hypothetical protein